MEDTETKMSQEEINKNDLANKAIILDQIKKSLLEAKGEPITGLTFHYKDRTITYLTYLDRKDVIENHVPVVDDIIDKIVPIIETERSVHKQNSDKIVIPKP